MIEAILEGMGSPRTLHGIVRKYARETPTSPALLEPGYAPLSYVELASHFAPVASALMEAGVQPGDRVALLLSNGAMMAAAMLSITSYTACVPLNLQLSEAELARLLAAQRIRALVTDLDRGGRLVETARAARIPVIELAASRARGAGAFELVTLPRDGLCAPEAQASALAVVLTTSGTTAEPKAVPYTHANLVEFASDIALRLELTARDRCLNVMPLFHSHGLFVALLGSLAAGGSAICTPGLFLVPDFFRWLKDEQPTWYTAVPTVHRLVLSQAHAHREQIASCKLRLIRAASAALSSAVAKELEETFSAPVIETYGLTEIIGWIAHTPLPPRPRKLGSVGVGGAHEIAILSPEGGILPDGQIGELAIRGRGQVVAYERDGALEPVPLADGWFRTGDQGYRDSDGYYFITGRTKEMINRGGEKVSPSEIENVLKSLPGVTEVVAFPVPTPTLGEEIGAVLVVAPNARVAIEDVKRFASKHLSTFKIPKVVCFVDEIPRSATGKYQRLTMAQSLGLTSNNKAASSEAMQERP